MVLAMVYLPQDVIKLRIIYMIQCQEELAIMSKCFSFLIAKCFVRGLICLMELFACLLVYDFIIFLIIKPHIYPMFAEPGILSKKN